MKAPKITVFTGEGSTIDNYNKPQKELQKVVQGRRKNENWGLFDKNNPKHKVILSLLYQMQWVKPSEKWGEVPDLKRLSEFLQSDKSPVKKKLMDMEPEELEKLIKALNGIVRHRYK